MQSTRRLRSRPSLPLLAAALLLAACSGPPDLGPVPAGGLAGDPGSDRPQILPVGSVLQAAQDIGISGATAESLEARAALLRARAAMLRARDPG